MVWFGLVWIIILTVVISVWITLTQHDAVEANAVVIGAWNENDEGHWIVPSLLAGV